MSATPAPDLDALDRERLQRQRQRFLRAGEADGPVADYWRDDDDLRHYDAVFAARIGWKWDAVLDELAQSGAIAPVGRLVDWGCGTGIAARRVLARTPAAVVQVHDRSPRAMAFARDRLRGEQPGIEVDEAPVGPTCAPDLLLISHVLDELEPRGLEQLLQLVDRSLQVVWVEPGSRAVARRLASVRDGLLARFAVEAPCPHQGPCSALRAGDRHWCHFFARPPAAVFQDGGWVRLGRELGVDLRSVPYAFVALRRGDGAAGGSGAASRLLGRPEVGGKVARCWVCTADGLEQREVVKSRQPELFRRLRRAADRGEALRTL